MSDHPNLADPDFEPTDEQLEGLMSRAFADVRGEAERRQERLRENIARERERVMARLHALRESTSR